MLFRTEGLWRKLVGGLFIFFIKSFIFLGFSRGSFTQFKFGYFVLALQTYKYLFWKPNVLPLRGVWYSLVWVLTMHY